MGYGMTIDLNVLRFSLLFLIVFMIYYILTMKRRKKLIDERTIIHATFIFYILALLYFVWLPIDIYSYEFRAKVAYSVQGYSYTMQQIANVNIIPLRSLATT